MNLTQQHRVVSEERKGFDPKSGHSIVVCELVENELIFVQVLAEGEVFVPRKRFTFAKPQYASWAVNKQPNLQFAFTEPFYHMESVRSLGLTFTLQFAVCDERLIVHHLPNDPLKMLRDEVVRTFRAALIAIPWEVLFAAKFKDRFADVSAELVSLHRVGLARTAEQYGITLKDIQIVAYLSNQDAALEQKMRDAALDVAKTTALRNVAEEARSPEAFIRASQLVAKALQVVEHNKLLPAPAGPGATVCFSCCYPNEMEFDVWGTVLAYVYVPQAERMVKGDSELRLGTRRYRDSRAEARLSIERGAEIVAVPRLPGIRFNPPRASVIWLEDWHRFEFRVMAEGRQPTLRSVGTIAFYVGPVLVAEVGLSIALFRASESKRALAPAPGTWADGCAYQAIFVCYSHDDASVVEKLEQAYTALGIECLRDSRILRSGVDWKATLLRKIEEADIFQLCWSHQAKLSGYVEEEWRHAVSLSRPFFVRPVYWEKPMPVPPHELAHIHFAYLDW